MNKNFRYFGIVHYLVLMLIMCVGCNREDRQIKAFKNKYKSEMRNINYPIRIDEITTLISGDVDNDNNNVVLTYEVDMGIDVDINYDIIKLNSIYNLYHSIENSGNVKETLNLFKKSGYTFKYVYKERGSDKIYTTIKINSDEICELFNYPKRDVINKIDKQKVLISWRRENEVLPKKVNDNIMLMAIMVTDEWIFVKYSFDSSLSPYEPFDDNEEYIGSIIDFYNQIQILEDSVIELNYKYMYFDSKSGKLLDEIRVLSSEINRKRKSI